MVSEYIYIDVNKKGHWENNVMFPIIKHEA